MKRRIELKQKYERRLLSFKSRPMQYNYPSISVILKSPETQVETFFTKKFILDTGASISIINATYQNFIQELKQIDSIKVRYGRGKEKELPVFKVIFIIKAQEIISTVAYDKDISELLLGQFDFFDQFTYTIFDNNLASTRLIKA